MKKAKLPEERTEKNDSNEGKNQRRTVLRWFLF
jgi:hypothetical protein